jgi:hypothetical protein
MDGQQGLSSNPSEQSESSGQTRFKSRLHNDDCQLVFPGKERRSSRLHKVEEEKSSDVFCTEQESSDFLSVKDHELESPKNWAEIARVAWSHSTFADYLLWLCEGLYLILINILLVPIAVIGLTFDNLRRLLRKVSDDVALLTFQCPSKLKCRKQPDTQAKRVPLQIVLDLDKTLVFCTKQKPDKRSFKEGRDFVVVHVSSCV